MQPRVLIIVCVLAGLPLCVWWQAKPSSVSTQPEALPNLPRVLNNPPTSLQFVGTGSCSAAACHNGNGQPGQPRTEYAVWLTRDRHAKAFEILYDERSVRIQKNLGTSTLAHEDSRCLSCHVSPGLTPSQEKKVPHFRVDGVSCESCHGPAESWLALHYQDSWQQKSADEKRQLGMVDTQSILGRAKVCMGCHVGAPGQDVDHDLIAAGHPRLNFEFASFHANMPHHWPDAKDRDPDKSTWGRPDFEGRAWAVGQVVSAHAALELLAERAADVKKPWPEFAEHDCYACHHSLQSPSWRQRRQQQPARPGSLVWSPWYSTMTHQALHAFDIHEDPLAALRKQLQAGWKNRQEVATKARQGAQNLHDLIGQIDRKQAEVLSARTLLRQLLASDVSKFSENWDEASQFGLSLAAMQRAQRDMHGELPAEMRSAIQDLSRDLAFPKSYDSPRGFDPEAVRRRLLELRELSHK